MLCPCPRNGQQGKHLENIKEINSSMCPTCELAELLTSLFASCIACNVHCNPQETRLPLCELSYASRTGLTCDIPV